MIFGNIDQRTELQRQLDAEARRYQAENAIVENAAPERSRAACDLPRFGHARTAGFGNFATELIQAE